MHLFRRPGSWLLGDRRRQEGVGSDEEEEGIGRSLRMGLKESLNTKEIAEDSQSCVARRDRCENREIRPEPQIFA